MQSKLMVLLVSENYLIKVDVVDMHSGKNGFLQDVDSDSIGHTNDRGVLVDEAFKDQRTQDDPISDYYVEAKRDLSNEAYDYVQYNV